jgi:tetratricopeptide (TPR) repeat protein
MDIQAHDLYLQGQYFMDRLNGSGIREAIDRFSRAIRRDSLYAQAWAGLADAHSSLGIGNAAPIPPRPEFEQARIAATRALVLDSTLAEAHAALALVQMMYDFDWAGAAQSLDRAQLNDPGYAFTYLYRSFLLSWLGKFDEATVSTREALHMDPGSFRFRQDIGRTLLLAHRFGGAERELRQLLALDSTNGRAQMLLGEVLFGSGRAVEAVSELERAQRNLPATRVAAFRAAAYARAGRRAEARALADSLTTLSETKFVAAQDLAIAWAGVRDVNNALTWLERAYDDRTLRPFVRDPVFDFLVPEPRYRALFTRMRLPPPFIPVTNDGKK